MAYTTEAAVRAATGFTDTDNIASATINAYIADADSVINSKVAKRYALPLSVSSTPATPDIVEALSRHITVGLLYANEYGEESENTDKGWQKRMDWAMDILDKIQKGQMELYNASGVEFDRSNLRQPSFYPTATSSEEDADDTTYPRIKMNGEF